MRLIKKVPFSQLKTELDPADQEGIFIPYPADGVASDFVYEGGNLNNLAGYIVTPDPVQQEVQFNERHAC